MSGLNHLNICKPCSRSSVLYQKTLQFIRRSLPMSCDPAAAGSRSHMWSCGSWFPVMCIFTEVTSSVLPTVVKSCQRVNRHAWMFIQNCHMVSVFVVTCCQVIGWQDRLVMRGSMCHVSEVRLQLGANTQVCVVCSRWKCSEHCMTRVFSFSVMANILHLCSKLTQGSGSCLGLQAPWH